MPFTDCSNSADCACYTCHSLRRLLHAVEGNGEPGLKIRVDRLEQLSKWVKLAVGAAFSGLGTAIYNFFTSKH